MAVYFLSHDPDLERTASIERRIEEVVPGLITISKIEDAVQSGNTSPSELSYVLLVGPSDNEDYLVPLLAMAQQNRHRFFFILISEEISTSNYKRLIRTQGAEWVSATGVAQELVEIFAKHRVAAPVPATSLAQRQQPVTITFVPAAGGVGNTTLIKEVGVQLKARKDLKEQRICIVDLDFQTSHLCDHLDIEPRLQISEILDNPERLDSQLFAQFISHHQSGVDIFAAPRSKFNLNDIDVATLDSLFDMIGQRYDWILIDLPVTWFGWTAEIIANSTGVIVSGINTIPCLHQISESLALARSSRSDPGSVAVAINRCERGLMGGIARRDHAKSVLGQEVVFFVRDDTDAMVESVNTGVPVSLSGSGKLVKEIGAIASFCVQIKSPDAQSRAAAAGKS